MNYKLAVFDMDGTILNTLDDLTDSLNAVFARHGIPTRTVEQVRRAVGSGIRLTVERSLPCGTDAKTVDMLFEEMKDYYADHCAERTAPYAGVVDMIKELRAAGVKTAVVSNKIDSAVQELAHVTYFSGCFDTALGEREGLLRKPAPDMVELVLQEMGVSREEAVYIGDSDVDVLTARNSQMDGIFVTWGFRDEDELRAAGATTIVGTVEEVKQLILG